MMMMKLIKKKVPADRDIYRTTELTDALLLPLPNPERKGKHKFRRGKVKKGKEMEIGNRSSVFPIEYGGRVAWS